MTPPIFTLAVASPAVQAALGVAPTRLYPFGKAPQPVAKPYAVWQVITGAPENYLGQRPDIDALTTQVTVYGTTIDSARSAAIALRDALELDAHVVRWGGDDQDYETQNYFVSFDVDWLVPR